MCTAKSKAPFESRYENFFRYTSGRWLWDEEQQLRDRYRVGSKYIIMEDAVGKLIANEWDNMSANAKLAIMRELVGIEEKLLSVLFSQ